MHTEPVLNPDGTQAISADECARYVSYLRTLSDTAMSLAATADY